MDVCWAAAAVPKAGSVFTTVAQGHRITLYGSQLCFRSYDRAARRFKGKPTIELS